MTVSDRALYYLFPHMTLAQILNCKHSNKSFNCVEPLRLNCQQLIHPNAESLEFCVTKQTLCNIVVSCKIMIRGHCYMRIQRIQSYLSCQHPISECQLKSWLLSLPIQLPADGKAAEDALNAWTSSTHMGDLGGISGSWLNPGPAPDHENHFGK